MVNEYYSSLTQDYIYYLLSHFWIATAPPRIFSNGTVLSTCIIMFCKYSFLTNNVYANMYIVNEYYSSLTQGLKETDCIFLILL